MKMTQRTVPFSIPSIGEEEINEVVDTLKSGWLTSGPKVKIFEDLLQKYIGCRYAVAVSSCSAALHLSLKILGVKPGDEVITTPLTFISTIFAIMQVGAQPVLADVDEATLTIDPEQIRKKINEKTKAIIPVHYGGHPCRMNEILKIAKENNLFVIEDAAHAVGSVYQGKKIGTLNSDTTCLSFYANKNLSVGEGGAILTDNASVAKQARILSLHGMSRDAWKRYRDDGDAYYDIVDEGYKYNFTDIQAALGIHQLKKLDGMNHTRKERVQVYNEQLKDFPELRLPVEREDVLSSWHLYPIRIQNSGKNPKIKNQVIQQLKGQGIVTSVHFIPVFLFTYMKEKFHFEENDFPETMRAFSEVISLPLYSKMSHDDVLFVCQNLKKILNKL